MFAKFWFLPARCSTVWPHEHFVQILQIFSVRLIWIIKGVEWWWWWSNWCRFAKLQKGDDLNFASKSPLVTFILVNVSRVNPSGQHKKCSPWYALGWGGKSWPGLVWDLLNRRAQSGWHFILGRNSHYHMWWKFEFSFALKSVSLIPKWLLLIY
jgi:hypothetical protein